MTRKELKAAIRDLGMTQEQFAKAIGRDRRTVLRWLAGKVPGWVQLTLVGLKIARKG